MSIDFKIKKFCSHCSHDSLQTYLAHHVYDEKQRELWDGNPDTAKEPAAYFVFACRNCGEVLLYHFQTIDEFECEDLFPFTQNGVKQMGWDQKDVSGRLQLMWPSRPPAEAKTAATTPRFQLGICRNCPTETKQKLLFATNEFSGPVVEDGTITGYAGVATLSLFRCAGCETNLFYRTMIEGECGYSIEDIETFNPEAEVLQLDCHQFHELSRCQYSTDLTYPNQRTILAPSTPESVKSCYELGARVRVFSDDLYALQLRKALEAICKNLGASQLRGDGKPANLWNQINELRDKNLLGSYIADAAQDLRQVSNFGAHYSEDHVTQDDIRKLEKLLGLITEYAYHRKVQA